MELANWYGNVQLVAMRPVLYHTVMANPGNRDLGLFYDAIHLTHAGNIFYRCVPIKLHCGCRLPMCLCAQLN